MDQKLGRIWECVISCAGNKPKSLRYQRKEREALAELKALLAEGADPNEEKRGERLLNIVASHGGLEATKILLSHGAEPGLKDKRGLTALMAACKGGQEAIAKHILCWGCSIDEVYSECYVDENFLIDWSSLLGWSALHFAAAAQSLLSVEALLDAGAASFPAKNGQTPVELARIGGREDIAETIERRMAARERAALEEDAAPPSAQARGGGIRL